MWPTRYSRQRGAFIDVRAMEVPIDVVTFDSLSDSDFDSDGMIDDDRHLSGPELTERSAYTAAETHEAAAARAVAAANAERDSADAERGAARRVRDGVEAATDAAAREAATALEAPVRERRDKAAATAAAREAATAAVGVARAEPSLAPSEAPTVTCNHALSVIGPATPGRLRLVVGDTVPVAWTAANYAGDTVPVAWTAINDASGHGAIVLFSRSYCGCVLD